ncbi:hypothetical protein C3L33_21461, partial [Rhododendron williamsianum]
FAGTLMALKRASSGWEDGDGSEAPRHESKRRLAFTRDVRDVLKGFSLDEFMTKLEPFFRNLVREEVERKILLFSHASPRQKIESEHGKPVKIVLLDAISKNIITSLTLTSIKVQIVVLNGDFGVDDEEDWTEEEFKQMFFTDNSSWIRSGRFKLGARTVSPELRIREAKSEAFAVKDRRGELYKKHHPPNFSDEIWRLEKISKDGQFHKRLASKGITTVKEFLCFYYRDPSSLRNVRGVYLFLYFPVFLTLQFAIAFHTWWWDLKQDLGENHKHATACVPDNKLYMYPRDEERVGIMLNSFFKVVAAVFDGQIYEPLDKLMYCRWSSEVFTFTNYFLMPGAKLGLVENLKRRAYKNLGDLVPLDDSPVFGPGTVPASLQPIILPGVHQVYQFVALSTNAIVHSTPSHGLMSMDSYSGPYCGGNSWAPGESLGPLMQIGHQTANDSFQIGTSTWGADGLFLSPSNQAVGFLSSDFGSDISRDGKPKLRWCMVRAVMKWGISVRRVVAAKKWQDLFA